MTYSLAVRRLFLCCWAGCILAGSIAATAQIWELPPIVGDQTDGWRAEPNWTWNAGNPMSADDGSAWRLCTQFSLRPEPDARHTDMQQGLYVDFERIWKGEKQEGRNPASQYRGHALGARSGDRPGPGMASVVMWRPPAAGTYRLEAAAGLRVQNESAGHARVQLYVLSADEASAQLIEEYLLNEPGGFRSDRYPSRLEIDQTVELAEGAWLALRLQAVNPGPAPVGSVAVDFSPDKQGVFRITAAEPG